MVESIAGVLGTRYPRIGMNRALRLGAVALAMAVLTAHQRISPVLPADPAADLVRVRLFLSTTASALDLAIDGALVANAVFTLRSGLPAVRMDLDRNTLHLTRNVQGASFDGQIDLILAAVPPRASV